jgi:hypothetical protein
VKATTASFLTSSPYKRHLVEEKDMKEETDRPTPNRKVEYKENSKGQLKGAHFIGKLEKLARKIKWMYTGKSPEHCK